MNPESHFSPLQVAWSNATIGCSPLTSLLPPLTELASSTKAKAYSIIAAKGATSYGIASIVVSICETVLFDQRQIRPVSHWIESLGCCLSLPAVLGRKGVLRTIDLPLNKEASEKLEQSAAEIRKGVEAANQK
jgi:L-lactate dehydrogenase